MLCRADDLLKVAERLRAERLRKSKKTMQSGGTLAHADANIVVLNIKTPRSGSMTDLPLAFALCRSVHAEAYALEANNRRDLQPARKQKVV